MGKLKSVLSPSLGLGPDPADPGREHYPRANKYAFVVLGWLLHAKQQQSDILYVLMILSHYMELGDMC